MLGNTIRANRSLATPMRRFGLPYITILHRIPFALLASRRLLIFGTRYTPDTFLGLLQFLRPDILLILAGRRYANPLYLLSDCARFSLRILLRMFRTMTFTCFLLFGGEQSPRLVW